MKTETCKLYSRDFWIFPPNIIKIDPYNFELYRFNVGPFLETQCSFCHGGGYSCPLARSYYKTPSPVSEVDRQTASDSERERKVQRGTETHRQYPVCVNPTTRRRERCSQRAQRTPSLPGFTSASGCITIIHQQQQQLTRLYVCQLDRISSLYNIHSTADDCRWYEHTQTYLTWKQINNK